MNNELLTQFCLSFKVTCSLG